MNHLVLIGFSTFARYGRMNNGLDMTLRTHPSWCPYLDALVIIMNFMPCQIYAIYTVDELVVVSQRTPRPG